MTALVLAGGLFAQSAGADKDKPLASITLTKTETITFTDVIAVADVPEHSYFNKIYRQLGFLFYKVRGYLIRSLTIK